MESSFNKARRSGERLPGNNAERRNYAYLSRLEGLVNKYGNRAEKALWHKSINDDLLVQYDNIPEAYWDSIRQALRDEGHGDVELTDSMKHEYCEELQKLQRESLQKWADYLGDKQSPYLLWFKIYAWTGMTRMGRYSKKKGKYKLRDKSTVAPYPEPDAEILAGVFDVVNRYYGNDEHEFYSEEGERNTQLEQVVQSGNFAKIFGSIQHDVAPIVEPPEDSEDVHGQWMEYSLGDEEDIARAAKGTGWCVASSAVANHYLQYGTYGNDNDWGYDDEESAPESRFILFHLEDPKSGKLSKNAVASIRLDTDGYVAEISGLEDGQALSSSLVSTVEEKVKSLPGGEKFLKAFADKKMLIALDRKMQNGEDLTKEELEFLYEINQPITTLDTYNQSDPRIDELLQRYNLEYALNNGLAEYVDQLISRMDPYYIAENLDTLINHDANIDVDQLVSKMDSYSIAKNLDILINHGANIDQLVSRMDSYSIAKNLDILRRYGANIG